MTIVTGIIVILAAIVGVVLTFLTLPGIWIAVGVALVCQIITPGLFNWWTLGAALVVAILAEVAEFLASAVGSGASGGTRYGAIGSIVGSLVGLLLGSFLIPIPFLGSILGAIIGAGAGALIAEMGIAKRSFAESFQSGRGAATGRAVSIVVKGGFAIVAALVLAFGVVTPW
ncbi:MAG: hypothetical protein CMJ31_12500 [Phycisphaerae bacterium]|nr:hypothetical protein [Phycisphaerae bacterium]